MEFLYPTGQGIFEMGYEPESLRAIVAWVDDDGM